MNRRPVKVAPEHQFPDIHPKVGHTAPEEGSDCCSRGQNEVFLFDTFDRRQSDRDQFDRDTRRLRRSSFREPEWGAKTW